jgi:hypothetical protein
MKTIVPLKQILLTTVFFLSCYASFSQSGTVPTSASQTSLELSFTNPTLISGTNGADGATYKFAGVNNNLDALVKITQRSSSLVTLVNLDVTTTGFTKAFQPEVTYNNGNTAGSANWWMEFQISFVNKNTMTPATIATFSTTALDIDGDNDHLHEWDSFYGQASYTVENTTLLSVTNLLQLIGSLLTPVGQTFNGPTTQFSNIDTAATSVMATVKYNNANSMIYRAGASTNGSASTDRMYSLWFKSFTFTAPVQTTLPLDLTSFTASLNNKTRVDLKWTTENEKNVSNFEIQRSYNGRDFETAAIVFANGNTTVKSNYSYSDNISNVQSGIIYYRLRMVDIDGRYSYSEVRVIRIGKDSGSLTVLAYPNPVMDQLRITIPTAWQGKEVRFDIVNAAGQMVRSEKESTAGQTKNFAVANLGAGIYYVKVSCGSDQNTQKIIKQ